MKALDLAGRDLRLDGRDDLVGCGRGGKLVDYPRGQIRHRGGFAREAIGNLHEAHGRPLAHSELGGEPRQELPVPEDRLHALERQADLDHVLGGADRHDADLQAPRPSIADDASLRPVDWRPSMTTQAAADVILYGKSNNHSGYGGKFYVNRISDFSDGISIELKRSGSAEHDMERAWIVLNAQTILELNAALVAKIDILKNEIREYESELEKLKSSMAVEET